MRSGLRGLPKHLLDDDEEDCVMEYLALAVAWLVVSTAFAVLVGKCIAAGAATGAARPASVPALGEVVPLQREASERDRASGSLSDAVRS